VSIERLPISSGLHTGCEIYVHAMNWLHHPAASFEKPGNILAPIRHSGYRFC
jgi:hypothetical protein